MREVFDAERLAFEIWRCGVALRMSAKGAPILVSEADPWFSDGRNEDLHRLVESL
jgi:hypothetical protein